tara:strand:- start:4361 stop:5305 length:945 start_codon:yes stop_codon:yes gene_type:complete
MSKRIPESELTFRARKKDKVVFPLNKKNVTNNKTMSKDLERDLAKKLIDKYPKLKEEGLTTGQRLKLTGEAKKRILEIIGSDKNIYDEMVSARNARKGKEPPKEKQKRGPQREKDESGKRKDMATEREIVDILVKKYPELSKYKTGQRLMVRGDKAREIRKILKTADDQKLYEEMVEERGKRKIQEGKGYRVPKKTDAREEEDRLGKAKSGNFRGKARKQSAPKKNAKTIPQQIARKELVSGKKITPAKTTPGQITLRNPPPGMTQVPVGMLKRNIQDSLAKGKFKVNKKIVPGQTYLKRNVRAGARGAYMLYQ